MQVFQLLVYAMKDALDALHSSQSRTAVNTDQ